MRYPLENIYSRAWLTINIIYHDSLEESRARPHYDNEERHLFLFSLFPLPPPPGSVAGGNLHANFF